MVELLLDTARGRRRASTTAYDAVYLALAETPGATLVTCDQALVRVPGRRAQVELVR